MHAMEYYQRHTHEDLYTYTFVGIDAAGRYVFCVYNTYLRTKHIRSLRTFEEYEQKVRQYKQKGAGIGTPHMSFWVPVYGTVTPMPESFFAEIKLRNCAPTMPLKIEVR
jgi:hypothetical protein